MGEELEAIVKMRGKFFPVKKKILLCSFFALSLSVFPISASIAASPKAGATCLKLNQSQVVGKVKFTCIKSGKKLVWDKGQAIPKFQPWSIPINQEQELAAFRNSVDLWFQANALKDVELNVYFDPSINSSAIDWITKALTFEAKSIGFPSPASYKIYIGKSDNWVISKRKSVMPGLDDWNPQYVCYDDLNEGCAQPTSQEVTFVWTTSSLSSPNDNWQFTRSLGHEFFHITQCDLIGDPKKCGDYFGNLPAWLFEGGPNVVGAIFMDRIGFLKYEDQRKFALSSYENGKLGGNYPLSAFAKNIRFSDLYPYEIGMLASEYLIASAGLQAFFDFYSNLPQSRSYEEAFQKSFGITLDNFYLAFDRARVNLGFYPVTKR